MTPLAANQLLDSQASDPDSFFLSAVWMSGAGIAADTANNIYFVTGNSDPSGTTYDGVTDIQESVIKVSGDLTQVLDLFTPSDWGMLDEKDFEIGSGGVVLLPPLPLPVPFPQPILNLAVAAGKDGNMYLMNQEDLGGYDPDNDNVLGVFPIGTCFCVASYYVDPSDQAPRLVTSGGTNLGIWTFQTAPLNLTNVANSESIFKKNHGFFTTVSSNGTMSPVVWAVGSLGYSTPELGLYAFDPTAKGKILQPIFSDVSFGTWNYKGNANLVPVVANGEVFVASSQELTIFGLNTGIRGGKAGHKPGTKHLDMP